MKRKATFQLAVRPLVARKMPYNTAVSTLQIDLRLESGELLRVSELGATELMFALAGSLMDTRLHEFSCGWLEPGNHK